MSFISRGFSGRRRAPEGMEDRIPPGQYYESGWPVLTAGPTPRIGDDDWGIRIDGLFGTGRTAGLDGIELRASDMDWSLGSGTPLTGTGSDLLLVLCGRTLPPGRLAGGGGCVRPGRIGRAGGCLRRLTAGGNQRHTRRCCCE